MHIQEPKEPIALARRLASCVTAVASLVSVLLCAPVYAQIVSGGAAQVGAAGNSVIIAGGKFNVAGSSITNTQTFATEISRSSGIRHKSFVKYDGYRLQLDRFGTEDFAGVEQKPSASIGSSEQTSQRIPTGSGQVVASLNPGALALPQSSLYHLGIGTTGRYVVETDPKFTDYRKWLGTDYLLAQIQEQPPKQGTSIAQQKQAAAASAVAALQPRLGDAFYEQRLIEQQIEHLTGQQFLKKPAAGTQGVDSAEAQFRSLMDSGAKAAAALDLVLGVALTKEQLEKLTTIHI